MCSMSHPPCYTAVPNYDTLMPVTNNARRSRVRRMSTVFAAFVGLCLCVVGSRAWWGWTKPRHTPRPFVAIKGLFMQEAGAADLPRLDSGVVPNFGALVDWKEIHGALNARRKLLLFIRHAEGDHNKAQKVCYVSRVSRPRVHIFGGFAGV